MVKTKDLDGLIKAKKIARQERVKELKVNESQGNYNIKGKGKETLIYMEDGGIKTGKGLFIPYDKISSIGDKRNLSMDKTVAFGLAGLAHGLKDKSVEIIFQGGKIVMKDVEPSSANKFITAVQNKILSN